MKKLLAGVFVALAACAALANPSHIEYIVPVPPGGAPDLVSRAIAKELNQALNIPFPVFNKPGAGSMLATREFVNEKNSNRVLSISGTVLLHTQLPKDDPLNLVEDIDFIGPVAVTPLGLITSAKFKNYDEFVAHARRDEVVCGTVRPIIENSTLYFAETFGLKIRMIPHRGTIDIKTALAGGHVDCVIDTYGPYRELEQAGRVKLLAYFHRNPEKPEVRVMPGNHPRLESALSIAVHRNMDPALRQRIVEVVTGLKNNTEFVQNMNNLGFGVPGVDPNYKQTIRRESRLLAPVRERAAALAQ